MPFCRHCAKPTADDDDLFCAKCGEPVTGFVDRVSDPLAGGDIVSNKTAVGSVGEEIIVGRNIERGRNAAGNIVEDISTGGGGISGSFNVTTSTTVDQRYREAEMWRTRQTRLPLRPPGRLAATVAVLSGLATIVTFLLKLDPLAGYSFLQPLFLIPVVIVFGWMMLWRTLRERRYLPVNPIKGGPAHGLEMGNDERLYYTILAARCPDCDGKMELRTSDDGKKRPIWICEKAPELHRLLFDHTQIPPLM